jgi:hypothetical protein
MRFRLQTCWPLPLILGEAYAGDADYLDSCRSKRNTAEYDMVGCTSVEEAQELILFVSELRVAVLKWLQKEHPELLAG